MSRKGFTLVELLVVIAIIVALAALSTPVILQQKKKADKVQAVNNCKQIFLALMDFDQDAGSFPDANTAAASVSSQAFTGNTSNRLLGQLIAEGYTTSEEIFFAKGGNPSGNKRPDNVISPTTQILAAGEVGFSYTLVTGGTTTGAGVRGLSTSDNGGIPLLCTPVASGGTDATFKPEPFGEIGVYLRIDGSAQTGRINKTDSKVRIAGNRGLFQTGQGTVWGQGAAALTPSVLLPE